MKPSLAPRSSARRRDRRGPARAWSVVAALASLALLAPVACSSPPPGSGSVDAVDSDGAGADTDAATDPGVETPDPGNPDPGQPDPGQPDPGQPDTPPDDGGEPDPGPPPDPKVCSGTVVGQLQPYGGACCYTPVSHPDNSNCVWYDPDFGEGGCLDDQCEDGYCYWSYSTKYCTRGCTVYADKLDNATGAARADGISDPGQPNDCDFAADGPLGAEYHCVNLNSPFDDPRGRCHPGTTFEECDATAECPEGEVCNLLYVHEGYETRCMTAAAGAGEIGDECNSDPNEGPVTPCKGPFCFGYGCVEPCAGDADCLTDRCEGGTCAKDPTRGCTLDTDCSAWGCEALTPYSSSSFTHDFCQPRDCRSAGDCRDPDWFCRPFWNGAEQVEDVAFTPMCRRVEGESVGYGEPCGVVGDDSGLPECAWSSGCIDNVCSGPCAGDGDCAEGKECLQTYEWSIDVDEDDVVDTWVNVDLCVGWPHEGELTACTTDLDCADGHHCRYRIGKVEGSDPERWAAEYRCIADHPDPAEEVGIGHVCGGDSGKECRYDLCLVPGGEPNADAMCTGYCRSADDCPGFITFEGTTSKTICLSLSVNHNQTDDPTQEVFVPYCWRTSSFGSLQPCDEKMGCPANEFCRALPIAGNPDEPVIVEHLCLDARDGLETPPTKEVGQPCESWTECIGRECRPDSQGGGYCSELCAEDADCASEGGNPALKCTEITLVPRADPANSGKTKRCLLEEPCLACESDNDCGGDLVCANFGAMGDLADLRCGAPCSSTDDCVDPLAICKDDIDATGAPVGRKVCITTACE